MTSQHPMASNNQHQPPRPRARIVLSANATSVASDPKTVITARVRLPLAALHRPITGTTAIAHVVPITAVLAESRISDRAPYTKSP